MNKDVIVHGDSDHLQRVILLYEKEEPNNMYKSQKSAKHLKSLKSDSIVRLYCIKFRLCIKLLLVQVSTKFRFCNVFHGRAGHPSERVTKTPKSNYYYLLLHHHPT